MLLSLLWLLVGGVLLYFGAEVLIRSAVSLAFRAGMTPLVVGLTVVAAGTSAPELVVSMLAALRDQSGIALGNVVGSNICNILLIAGSAALIRPMVVHRAVVRREMPVMVAVSVIAAALLWSGQALLRPEAALLLGLLALTMAWSIRAARREAEGEPAAGAIPQADRSVAVSVALLAAGLGMLALGADRFVEGAVELARALGLSEAVIGLTVVALGTSLPELATSIVAALRGESDLALGNIVGSNIFNLLGILGISGLLHPIALPVGAGVDLLVMLGAALLVYPLARTGPRLQRWEGAALVGLYIGYVAWLLVR
jgi:cation:H+ antiporter